jgi:signal transduction histidine kinase
MGPIQLLQNSELTSEQRDLVNIAKTCGEQLLVVINDILDYSKVTRAFTKPLLIIIS